MKRKQIFYSILLSSPRPTGALFTMYITSQTIIDVLLKINIDSTDVDSEENNFCTSFQFIHLQISKLGPTDLRLHHMAQMMTVVAEREGGVFSEKFQLLYFLSLAGLLLC